VAPGTRRHEAEQEAGTGYQGIRGSDWSSTLVRVRRLIGWTAGLAGVAALARLRARRRAATSPAPKSESAQGQPAQGQPAQGQPAQGQSAQGQPAQGQPADEPVDELRRKLAEARDPADFADPDLSESEDVSPDETIAERRRRVHEKAQEAIEAMKTLDG
jgi:hypothetical protein